MSTKGDFQFTSKYRGAILACCLSLAVACGEPAPPRHLVIVVLDTVGVEHLSLYGYSRETTPFLEDLAGSAHVFRGVKATAPWTVPSHASLFTGLWPSEHEAQWGRYVLAPRHQTLAEVLKERGFLTEALSTNNFVSHPTGLTQGFSRYGQIGGPPQNRTNLLFQALPEILDRGKQGNRRLFLFLNLMDAHIPYNTETFAQAFGVGRPGGPVNTHDIKWQVNAKKITLAPRTWQQHRAAYDAAIRGLDQSMEKLVALLRKRRMLDDTLLVITSDHGEGLGAHSEIGHSISVWEEQLAVPLLVRLPPGHKSRTPPDMTSLVALAPTVLDWLGVERPPRWQAMPDLYSVKQQTITADYRSYFSDARQANKDIARDYPQLSAKIVHSHVVYCDELKLIMRPDRSVVYYDLAHDPQEARALVGPLGYEPYQSCSKRYHQLRAQGRFTPFSDQPTLQQSQEAEQALDRESLRALGYIP